jgi:hypothetical protein
MKHFKEGAQAIEIWEPLYYVKLSPLDYNSNGHIFKALGRVSTKGCWKKCF